MNRPVKTSMLIFLCSLIFRYSSAPAQFPYAGDTPVPEPTHLHTVAVADGSRLVWSELLGEVHSIDARATISAIGVEGSDGEEVRGVKIALENSTSTDQIYLEESQLSILRSELEYMDYSSQFDGECLAKHSCVHGIARCRPSQTIKQAYCLATYSRPNSEGGLVLSTPRHSFKFPSIGTGHINSLIGEAVKVLE